MTNSIEPCLQFTGDLPEDHEDLKCMMLDSATWIRKTEDPKKTNGEKM